MRLIDADALSELLVKTYEKAPTEKALLFVSLLLKNNEEVPTVEERPQGKWIEKVERRGCYLGDRTVYSYTCPFCGFKEFNKYPFCHCGADMRKGGAEE